jgi:hypothetical protein
MFERTEEGVRKYLRHMQNWKNAPLCNRQYTAHEIAEREATKDRSNGRAYAVTKSHLLNNVTCPQDYKAA